MTQVPNDPCPSPILKYLSNPLLPLQDILLKVKPFPKYWLTSESLRLSPIAGYVGASCARTCHGLLLFHPVTINELNKPLNKNLRAKELRLDALALNTPIHHSFAEGSVVSVPNPKFEQQHIATILELLFSFSEHVSSRKRKLDRHNTEDRPSKRKQHAPNNALTIPTTSLMSQHPAPTTLFPPHQGLTTADSMDRSISLPFPCPNWDSTLMCVRLRLCDPHVCLPPLWRQFPDPVFLSQPWKLRRSVPIWARQQWRRESEGRNRGGSKSEF